MADSHPRNLSPVTGVHVISAVAFGIRLACSEDVLSHLVSCALSPLPGKPLFFFEAGETC